MKIKDVDVKHILLFTVCTIVYAVDI